MLALGLHTQRGLRPGVEYEALVLTGVSPGRRVSREVRT